MAIFDLPARLWTLARKVEDLFSVQSKLRETTDALDVRLRKLEEKMIRFEAEQDRVVDTAKSAAGVAAAAVASAVVSDVVTRITRVEMSQAGGPSRLPPA